MGTSRATGQAVAVKSVLKRRDVYVDMLRQEVTILKVCRCQRPLVVVRRAVLSSLSGFVRSTRRRCRT
jgi:hypothetical protein